MTFFLFKLCGLQCAAQKNGVTSTTGKSRGDPWGITSHLQVKENNQQKMCDKPAELEGWLLLPQW